MSDFKFSCPKCGLHVVCDTSNAGMQIPCPGCQTLLTVPQPPQAAAPAAPAPGRLTINKSAHQSHAPQPAPGAANAPAKPAWGAKPQPAPRAKKKSPWVPIIVVVAILAVAAIGWFGFGAPYLAKQAKQKQDALEAQQKAEQETKEAAAEAARAKKASWKLDLAGAKFPERHASGKHNGADFTVENTVFQGGALVLLQTTGTPRQFVISIPLKTGETLSGKTFNVASTATNAVQPRVVLNWRDDPAKAPSKETFAKGYAMKLEFGTLADSKLPGKIYLCVPDAEQSFVAGNFQIGPKTASPTSVAPAAPAAVDPNAGRAPLRKL